MVLFASLAGIAFTTIQIMDKIDIRKHPGKVLICDVNSTMSCTEGFERLAVVGTGTAKRSARRDHVRASRRGRPRRPAWQPVESRVPGSQLSRAYLAAIWGLAGFFLCFASWYMYETAFSIEQLCIWCTGIVTAVVLICAALSRVIDRAGSLGQGSFGRATGTAARIRLDLIVWFGWWLAIAGLLWVGLGF